MQFFHSRMIAAYLALFGFCFAPVPTHGQFTTVYNVPPDLAPETIGSDTQLNVFAGGSLGTFTNIGDPLGSSWNMEVNVMDGNGGRFRVYGDSTINASGGRLASIEPGKSGINVNVNVSGGRLGRIYSYYPGPGSAALHVTWSGGSTSSLFADDGSKIDLLGTDFKLDGVPVLGLMQPGDSAAINLPDDSLLTGSLADGTPFSISTFRHEPLSDTATRFDEIADGVLTLIQTAPAPPTTVTVINVPADPLPLGLRSGQTLNLDPGLTGSFGRFTAAEGSIVNIEGEFFAGLNAVGAQVNVSTGYLGAVLAYGDSTVNLQGSGIVDEMQLYFGSTADMTGGTLRFAYVLSGAALHVRGGAVGANGGLLAGLAGSTIDFSGGIVSLLYVATGGLAQWRGGRIEDTSKGRGLMGVDPGATLEVFGTSFLVDGAAIPGLQYPGDSLVLTNRGGAALSGLLADGSPFELILSTALTSPDYIDAAATLRLTVVPESSSLNMFAVSSLVLAWCGARRCGYRNDGRY